MHVGMYATTHGLMYRDNTNAFLRSMSASALQPVRIARLIEQLGFHSIHVVSRSRLYAAAIGQ